MLGGLLEGLIAAWILTLFNVDQIFIDVLQPFIAQVELTTTHFYFVLGLLGLVGGLIHDIHQQ